MLDSKTNKKNSLMKNYTNKMVSEFSIFALKWLRLPQRKKFVLCFLSSQINLLCIVEELAEGGFVAVAVGVSDM